MHAPVAALFARTVERCHVANRPLSNLNQAKVACFVNRNCGLPLSGRSRDAKCDSGDRARQQSPARLAVKPVTTIARTAATAAMWVKVEVLSLAAWPPVLQLTGLIVIQNRPLPKSSGLTFCGTAGAGRCYDP
jgi:hypothetical protein